MYTVNLNDLTPEQFLAQYWQKKPLLIRGGFTDFKDPISADELAGLAMEEQIESRLVWQKDGQWQAEHGPFEDYSHLGDKDWSLLIQGTDHFDADVAELIRPFRFIPNWRIDDVMVVLPRQVAVSGLMLIIMMFLLFKAVVSVIGKWVVTNN